MNNYANVWHGDMVWCHKVAAPDGAFEEKCFLWERGAFVGLDFDLFDFRDFLHAQEGAQQVTFNDFLID